MRPNRLEFSAVRQGLSNLHAATGLCLLPLGGQLAILQPRDHQPLHDAAFFQPLRWVLPDNVLLLADESPNRVEELAHAPPQRCHHLNVAQQQSAVELELDAFSHSPPPDAPILPAVAAGRQPCQREGRGLPTRRNHLRQHGDSAGR